MFRVRALLPLRILFKIVDILLSNVLSMWKKGGKIIDTVFSNLISQYVAYVVEVVVVVVVHGLTVPCGCVRMAFLGRVISVLSHTREVTRPQDTLPLYEV